MTQDDTSKLSAMQAGVALFSSTRTAVVLLGLIATAAVVGTVLPDPAARKYVYGRLWFHILLGLLGVNLVVCMLWRKRVGMGRVWSLFTHAGILLVLVGAMVTLILAERGEIVIRESETLGEFVPEDGRGEHRKPEPFGFDVKLVDFRITYYPPVDYLLLMRQGARPTRLRVVPGCPLRIPGTGGRLTGVALRPERGDGLVQVTMADGAKTNVPAAVGTTQALDDEGTALKMLRYEPSFKLDIKSKEVTSNTDEPLNPALQVALVRDGEQGRLRWLFAKMPDFAGMGRGNEPEEVKLRFLHPSAPELVAEADTAVGAKHLHIRDGKGVPSPWDPRLILVYERVAGRVKEYESEVEVVEGGRVVKRHVIQVNSPLVHRGTKLSQVGYDREGLRWSRLGVSRDSGVWFAYAGFLATTLGLMGKFYLRPLLRGMRRDVRTSVGSPSARRAGDLPGAKFSGEGGGNGSS